MALGDPIVDALAFHRRVRPILLSGAAAAADDMPPLERPPPPRVRPAAPRARAFQDMIRRLRAERLRVKKKQNKRKPRFTTQEQRLRTAYGPYRSAKLRRKVGLALRKFAEDDTNMLCHPAKKCCPTRKNDRRKTCEATTTRGGRCSNKACEGMKYCSAHRAAKRLPVHKQRLSDLLAAA